MDKLPFLQPAFWQGVNKFIQPHLEALQGYHFSFLNPLFDLAILLTFLFLWGKWGAKKSFSYCLIVALLLFFSSRIVDLFPAAGNTPALTTPDIIKLVSVFAICLVTIYYTMIKRE